MYVTANVMQAVIILETAVMMFTVQEVNICSEYHQLYLYYINIFIISLIAPTNCQDIGIHKCCSTTRNVHGICNVFGTNPCSCDVSCHERNDCCSDAETIGCLRKLSHACISIIITILYCHCGCKWFLHSTPLMYACVSL